MSDIYWDSAYRADRSQLLDACESFWPFGSVLEIGSNTGPVRRRLRERFGYDFDYVGLDFSEPAIALAKTFARDDARASFQFCDVRQGLPFNAKTFDIVLSAWCLMSYEAPVVEAILTDMKRVAARAVIVHEDYGQGEQVPGRGYAHGFPEWVVRA